jgi:small nuclear ribonucleoprotein (snRNP)-like protein
VLPLHALEKSKGSSVEVTLHGKRRLRGTLAGLDEHMNVVLHQAFEDPGDGATGRALGTVVVRGNHIVSIALV